MVLGPSIVLTSGVMELAKANKEAKTTLYFFSTKGVDFKRKVIQGKSFNHSTNRWENGEFPFPDVLYVRGGSGRGVNKLARRFEDMGIKRINPITGFNKSELFHKLGQDNRVREFLPYTQDLERLSDLRTILQKRNTVYIKACQGRRGTKVMRVEKLAEGDYEYSYSIIGKLFRERVRSFESLQKEIQSFFGDRKIIVQEAIDLVKVNGTRPVDCRAELQRTKNGEIEIVGISIRVGQSKSPITTHASAYSFESYLQRLFPKYSREELSILKSGVYYFLNTVYRSVEEAYGKFGEIGIDFAIDKRGRIWLIECNAQSAKVSIRKSYNANIVRKVYLNPLEYASTLMKNSSYSRRGTDYQNRSFYQN